MFVTDATNFPLGPSVFFFAADILNVVLEFEVKEQRNIKTGKILLTTIYFSRCAFPLFKKLVAETFRHFYLALCMKIW